MSALMITECEEADDFNVIRYDYESEDMNTKDGVDVEYDGIIRRL